MTQPLSQRSTLYSTQSPRYASLYITLLRKLQRVDTVQSVLASITEMLLSDPINAIPAYHGLRSGNSSGEDGLYAMRGKLLYN
ncbi:MAG: hypothetical protein EOP54_32935 [Sphingobacteriales bacterium]|nr:MAG: hypothetical protein EOP54_32935 [Sphingobacteriales bacterium]